MGVVQAQDYNGAKWALGVRLPGSTDHSIEQALERREIVRTWAFRGTLFFISPADVRWMVNLVGQRVIDSIQGRYRRLELDESTLGRANDLIVKSLQERQELTRSALLTMLEKNGISTRGLRAAHILQRAALEGLVCQTVALKNNPTYILMESLVPLPKLLSKNEAIIELARRYFASHGPTTMKDFAWWVGLPLAEARIGLEAIQSQLIEETIDGQKYWYTDSNPSLHGYAQNIYLLPAYDEYLLGYQNRSLILDIHHAKLLSQGNGLNPFIVKDGRVIGIWRRIIGKKEVRMKIDVSTDFMPTEMNALHDAAHRYGEFLGFPVKIL